MKAYLDLMRRVLEQGESKQSRTGTGTRSLFGHQMRFDLSRNFPLVTTKKIHMKSVIHELLWFLAGNTNIKTLQRQGVRIWNEWATDTGDLGPIYGYQWRSWPTHDGRTIDQIALAVHQIKNNPHSRRIIVSAWNPADLPDEQCSAQDNVRSGRMALAPCHTFFQFYVQERRLSCQLYQRSADVFLGVPFNIASYALLTLMIAQVCELRPGDFVHTFGDAHLYRNHLEQARLQLSREPRTLPQIRLNPNIRNLDDFRIEDIELIGYDPHPHIAGKIAI